MGTERGGKNLLVMKKKVKKVLSVVMFGAMMMSGLVIGGQPVEGKAADATPEPVLYYDFEAIVSIH